MLLRPDSPTNAIKPVGSVDPAARATAIADPRQEAFARSLSGLLGKTMLAQVLSRMNDGSFLVRVEGTPVRMMLPPGAQAGTELPLTMVAASPRPTFQITGGDGQAMPAMPYQGSSALAALTDPALAYDAKAALLPGQASTGALAKAAPLAPAGTAAELAQADANAPPAPVLSEAARVITSVLSAAHNAPGKALVLTGTEPLIAAAKPDPAQLATKLAQVISESGLFYESHLAEWASGTRTLGELMQEPQVHKAPGAPATDPTTAQFINLQLTSQEQSRVAWHGQLAPGQQMAWEIHKDAPEERGAGHGEELPVWRSGMRFRLPLLGEIDATVVMVGDRCKIEIKAASEAVSGTLRGQAARLTASMEAAGTPLTSLSIGVKPAPEAGDG